MSIPRWSDGAGVATLGNSSVIGGLLVVHVFEIADAATADYSITLTHKTEITDIKVIKTGGAGVAVTATIKNGTDAITDAMVLGVADKVTVAPLTIDDAYNVIAAAGTLKVSVVRTTSGAGMKVICTGIRRA